jgi:hypothetical protein
LAEYLTIVRPLEVFLSCKFNCKGGDDLNEFLWADYKKGRWDGEFLSDLLKITTSEHKMQALGFRDYRQVAVAFMEKHVKYKVKDIQGVNSILDLQGGHSSLTVGRDYAVSTEDHGQISRETMHQYYLASMEWSQLLLSSGTGEEEKQVSITSELSDIQRSVEMVSQMNDDIRDIMQSQSISEGGNQRSRMQDIMMNRHKGMLN